MGHLSAKACVKRRVSCLTWALGVIEVCLQGGMDANTVDLSSRDILEGLHEEAKQKSDIQDPGGSRLS